MMKFIRDIQLFTLWTNLFTKNRLPMQKMREINITSAKIRISYPQTHVSNFKCS